MIDVAGLNLDLTITAGNILEMAVIAGGGLLALSRFTTKIAILSGEFSSVKTDITDMKTEIKKVNELLAMSREADRRIGRLEDDLREIRHGDGFVTGRGRAGINGEYK